MAESRKDATGQSEESKQPFVSQEDRPEVGLGPDKPVGELRVRELVAILGETFAKTIRSEVSEYGQIGTAKQLKRQIKVEKLEIYKELKNEKWEYYKELKLEKWEIADFHIPIDLEHPHPPDTTLDRLIHTVSGLARQVVQLGNQLEALQKRLPG